MHRSLFRGVHGGRCSGPWCGPMNLVLGYRDLKEMNLHKSFRMFRIVFCGLRIADVIRLLLQARQSELIEGFQVTVSEFFLKLWIFLNPQLTALFAEQKYFSISPGKLEPMIGAGSGAKHA